MTRFKWQSLDLPCSDTSMKANDLLITGSFFPEDFFRLKMTLLSLVSILSFISYGLRKYYYNYYTWYIVV